MKSYGHPLLCAASRVGRWPDEMLSTNDGSQGSARAWLYRPRRQQVTVWGRPRTLQLEVSERIVAATVAGQNPTKIAGALNDEGVPTARGGKRWYPSTVLAVICSSTLDQVARTWLSVENSR